MLKKVLFCCSFIFIGLIGQAQSLSANKSSVKFSSVTEAEVIESINEKTKVLLDTTTGAISILILINDFQFENALMEEHFQENYLESNKYPTSTFKGVITNIKSIPLHKNGDHAITVEGDLTMHGITKSITANGTLTVANKKLSASCSFAVVPQDYAIKVPAGLNLAEKIDVTVRTGTFEKESSLNDVSENVNGIERATASYKNSKVINAQSLETTHQGVLDFRISHRFGQLNGGAYELFGLDQASLRLSFDYGVTKRLMIGFGRSTYEKTYDGYIKYKILWQTAKSNRMPITLIYYTNASINTLRFNNLPYKRTFDTRLNYVHQLIFGRKFNEQISLQLMPTIVHRNFVLTAKESNTVMAIGAAGRWKFLKRVALNAEYFYVLPNQLATGYKNSLSLGFDIETGGHVFQLHFTNSPIMLDKGYITETTGDWLKGDIHFGFNISRVFVINKPKKKEPVPSK